MRSNSEVPLQKSKSSRGWRWLRRALITLAWLVTLVALFYAVENWRGKRAWEECRRDAESKGLEVNWTTYVPKPVPDDQNFFKAPGIDPKVWTGRGSNELNQRLSRIWPYSTNRLVLAKIQVISPQNSNGAVHAEAMVFGSRDAQAHAERRLRSVLGPALSSAPMPQLITLRRVADIRADSIQLIASGELSEKDVSDCFPRYIQGSHLEISKTSDPASFEVILSRAPITASELLTATESLNSDFAIIREAVKRPFARMDGDYEDVLNIPIPNFVLFRSLAQMLTDRARANLLMGHSAEALNDLTLLLDLCRVLESRPERKPTTLVAAMIRVAIAGLYLETASEGLKLRAWSATEMAVLQEQLSSLALLPGATRALQTEPIAVVAGLERVPARTLAGVLYFSPPKPGFFEQFKEPRYLLVKWMPRGWRHQNMVTVLKRAERTLPYLDSKTVSPKNIERINSEVRSLASFSSPYTFLSDMFFPLFSKALQTTARREIEARQIFLALALERYRVARGEYPPKLTTLVPEFLNEVPRDIINGGELVYDQENGAYVIYSVGWNESDDGGRAINDKAGKPVLTEGDWVWQMPPPGASQKATKQTKE